MIPIYNEGQAVLKHLKQLLKATNGDGNLLLVLDSNDDPTIPFLEELAKSEGQISIVINDFGPGPANAIRYGFSVSKSDTVVVAMADGCDDYRQIPELVHLISRGVDIACASRYSPGGQQIGGPRLKRVLSRLAGLSFRLITGVATSDATNSFKAYNRDFLSKVEVESSKGFEIGMELVAKAVRNRVLVAEIPTTWIERDFGVSNFKIFSWIPAYLRWYLYGIGLIRRKK